MCTRHQVLLIADEVMCGSGRCSTWSALEHDRVTADIVAVAKGLAGGYIPLAATIFGRDIGNTIVREQGAVLTGHTFPDTRPPAPPALPYSASLIAMDCLIGCALAVHCSTLHCEGP